MELLGISLELGVLELGIILKCWIRNVQVLHLDLKAVDGNYVELRYFVDNPNQYARRSLPHFVTETLTGEAYFASAADIAQELQFRLPKLIFLSGCRTGQAGNAGSVPSMAEELLQAGAKAVLGWGQSVLDLDAIAAAAALYQELSAGKQITEAIACTYQALIKHKARDWHLLRLYAAGDLPSALVTPLRTRGRKPAPPPTLKANCGEITEAIALFQQSLALCEQIGNVQGKAMTLWWLGHIAEQQGNYNQALDYLQPALEILQRIQSPDAERLGQVVARVEV
ncbi:tetratricopeptide repeat protein [Fischerella thermalis]|uniref:tetratricopeptide repeat protein n=1 Tax=Fischerella thermalis TaxID=372787 RepID=UPI0021552948|nr:tetratricopeptide repeat protein [Fischerella thermalis]